MARSHGLGSLIQQHADSMEQPNRGNRVGMARSRSNAGRQREPTERRFPHFPRTEGDPLPSSGHGRGPGGAAPDPEPSAGLASLQKNGGSFPLRSFFPRAMALVYLLVCLLMLLA